MIRLFVYIFVFFVSKPAFCQNVETDSLKLVNSISRLNKLHYFDIVFYSIQHWNNPYCSSIGLKNGFRINNNEDSDVFIWGDHPSGSSVGMVVLDGSEHALPIFPTIFFLQDKEVCYDTNSRAIHSSEMLHVYDSIITVNKVLKYDPSLEHIVSMIEGHELQSYSFDSLVVKKNDFDKYKAVVNIQDSVLYYFSNNEKIVKKMGESVIGKFIGAVGYTVSSFDSAYYGNELAIGSHHTIQVDLYKDGDNYVSIEYKDVYDQNVLLIDYFIRSLVYFE